MLKYVGATSANHPPPRRRILKYVISLAIMSGFEREFQKLVYQLGDQWGKGPVRLKIPLGILIFLVNLSITQEFGTPTKATQVTIQKASVMGPWCLIMSIVY